MIIILRQKATESEIMNITQNFALDHVNIVVDVERKVIAAGGNRHLDAQQLLVGRGSLSQNLWGGGFSPKTKQVSFRSILNLRPPLNSATEIISPEIRNKFEKIVKDLLF